MSSLTDAGALARIRKACLRFPGTEEAALQGRPLFRVVAGNRRFAIFNGADAPPRPRWNSSGRSLHFVTDPSERDALTADGRFTPSPHHGDRGWLALRLDQGDIDWDEVDELVEAAYRCVIPAP